MDKYISQEAAVAFAQHAYNEWNLAMAAADGNREINLVYKRQELCKAVKSVFSDMPAADVAPVVHAEWEIVTGSDGKEYMVCGECRKQQSLTGTFLHCPNCGAKMDGGTSNEN